MEQTWYLFPGQTLENTKPEDRGKALVATKTGWKRITDHLDRKKVQADILQKNLDHRQYLKDGSYEMTKAWDNSIEKIRQRRFEEHAIKQKQHEENLYNRFMQLRKEQAEERTNFVADVKRKMFMTIPEHSRSLNSALLLSEVLHERKLQQQFDIMEKEHERIEEEKYAQLVQFYAEQEKKINEEKIQKRREKDVDNCNVLRKQIKQIQDDEKNAREERIKKEREDNIRAVEEYNAIKEYEFKLDRDKKADVKKQFNDYYKIQQQYKEEDQKQEKIKDTIIDIQAKAKCRIDTLKKKRDNEMETEKTRIRDRITSKLSAALSTSHEEEERVLANALREFEEREQKMLKKKEDYQNKLRKDLEQYRMDVIKRTQKENEERKELKKWEMVNRLKSEDVIRKYEQDKAQRLFDDKIRYREELNKQVRDEDKTEYNRKCLQAELDFYSNKNKKDDEAFLNYADEIMDLLKSRGRSIDPVLNVVQKYKIDNRLETKKKNLSMLQSKVPINKK